MKIQQLISMGLTVITLAEGVGTAVSKLSSYQKKKGKSGIRLLPAALGALGTAAPSSEADLIANKTFVVAEDAAAAEVKAAEAFPIRDCRIIVKDVPYTGEKMEKLSVKVAHGDRKLKKGEDYTFSYDKNAREIGLYTLNITGKGLYTGSMNVPFYIVPKAKSYIKLLSGDEKEASQVWRRLKNVTGCEIRYSLENDFSGSREQKLEKLEDLGNIVGNLKPGEKYYVCGRIYTAVNGETYCSGWSKVKILETSGNAE